MLYQLSYASPNHPENTLKTVRKPIQPYHKCADTLPLRTHNGTENKVSTPPPAEQTG